ncbi:MAG: dethiobiotin synthase [Holosporales bacterium]|jgi:dethiobiotin synthase|nr:dethiobiotin synthase [Holosporales bacterium]
MNIFVTGTDTGVGKTIISSWICRHSGAKYWKPVQTGADSDSRAVRHISPRTVIIPEAYKLKAPLSAYDSAKLENATIEPAKIIARIPNNAVIEGAGGVLVPIAEGFFLADLIQQVNCKVVVVARSKLGFQNHIYLTIEALMRRNIDVLGIVINSHSDFVPTIERFSGVKVLQVFPWSKRDIVRTISATVLPREISDVIEPMHIRLPTDIPGEHS